MSASLVGSEMCIRDSSGAAQVPLRRAAVIRPRGQGASMRMPVARAGSPRAPLGAPRNKATIRRPQPSARG
eukprot:1618035-Alexandrium_andersonii.AAC.1